MEAVWTGRLSDQSVAFEASSIRGSPGVRGFGIVRRHVAYKCSEISRWEPWPDFDKLSRAGRSGSLK
jgi:hypothetical protein